MKNKLLVLLSLIMIVFSTSAFAKKVEKMPVNRDGLYYEHFSTNIANGQYESYHDNGQLQGIKTYKDGKKDGLYEKYYDNGKLEERVTYKDRKLDGLWETYYKNGQLWGIKTYKDGKLEGLYVLYNEDGTLELKCFYVNGKQYECEYASESKGILE